jgi:hypothetical protein
MINFVLLDPSRPEVARLVAAMVQAREADNGEWWAEGRDFHGGKRRPCRDGGGGEIARCLASARKGDRAFNIDPPSVVLRHHAEGLSLPRREQWTRQGCSRRA